MTAELQTAEPQTGKPQHVSSRPDPLAVVVDATRRLGEQTALYCQALAATPDAIRRYPGEVLRLVATMGLGTGALAVIGGTVVIVGFLTLSTGAVLFAGRWTSPLMRIVTNACQS